MIIYIALIKSSVPLRRSRLIIQDSEELFKARLKAFPKIMIETIATHNTETNLTRYFSTDDYLT
jgi:hypothetical protein